MSPIEGPGPALGLPRGARALLNAFVAISSDLDMHSVLERIVTSACELTGARYGGALGVIGNNGELSDFITRGMSPEVHEQIGDLPRGRGLLRELLGDHASARIKALPDATRPSVTTEGHPEHCAVAHDLHCAALGRGQQPLPFPNTPPPEPPEPPGPGRWERRVSNPSLGTRPQHHPARTTG